MTAGPTPASASNPSTNSLRIRSARQVSVSRNAGRSWAPARSFSSRSGPPPCRRCAARSRPHRDPAARSGGAAARWSCRHRRREPARDRPPPPRRPRCARRRCSCEPVCHRWRASRGARVSPAVARRLSTTNDTATPPAMLDTGEGGDRWSDCHAPAGPPVHLVPRSDVRRPHPRRGGARRRPPVRPRRARAPSVAADRPLRRPPSRPRPRRRRAHPPTRRRWTLQLNCHPPQIHRRLTGDLVPGGLAVTVPRTGCGCGPRPGLPPDSVLYTPVLPVGTSLVVTAGPVEGIGLHLVPGRAHRVRAQRWRGPGLGGGGGPRRDPVGSVARRSDARLRARLRHDRPGRRVEGGSRPARQAAVNAFGLALYRRILTDPDLRGRRHRVLAVQHRDRARDGPGRREGRDGRRRWTPSCTPTAGPSSARGSRPRDGGRLPRGADATWGDAEPGTHTLALRIANPAFGQRGCAIEQAYLQRSSGAFRGGARPRGLRGGPGAAKKAINGWVSRQTLSRIPTSCARGRHRGDPPRPRQRRLLQGRVGQRF